MVKKNLLRHKKGVSPVIAVLLLMLITVAAGVILYSYVMGWIGGVTTGASVQTGELSLDAASGDDSDNQVVAYIRNIGSSDLTVHRTYEDGTNRTFTVSPSSSVAVGGVVSVTMTGCGTVAGYTAEIKIVCTDGTALVFPVKFEQ